MANYKAENRESFPVECFAVYSSYGIIHNSLCLRAYGGHFEYTTLRNIMRGQDCIPQGTEVETIATFGIDT